MLLMGKEGVINRNGLSVRVELGAGAGSPWSTGWSRGEETSKPCRPEPSDVEVNAGLSDGHWVGAVGSPLGRLCFAFVPRMLVLWLGSEMRAGRRHTAKVQAVSAERENRGKKTKHLTMVWSEKRKDDSAALAQTSDGATGEWEGLGGVLTAPVVIVKGAGGGIFLKAVNHSPCNRGTVLGEN